VRCVLIIILLPTLLLLGCQRFLIYHPRSYSTPPPAGVERLPAVGAPGQVSWWMPPRSGRAERVWLCFGGNAMRARDWHPWLATAGDADAGYLLIEYPGYGDSSGWATPAAILAATRAAVAALAARLGEPEVALSARAGVLGHSLGCAAALQYAAACRVRRAVLVSPFTTMLAMARRRVGWPLCHLLHHRFDNEWPSQNPALRDSVHSQ